MKHFTVTFTAQYEVRAKNKEDAENEARKAMEKEIHENITQGFSAVDFISHENVHVEE
ncbi:MAG: hypothetical protein HY376_01960 [Candidatus Blackburnbacteria bacterium]|nr:hypothetical protein [Candidatus Blackburnbacteria bacterium]